MASLHTGLNQVLSDSPGLKLLIHSREFSSNCGKSNFPVMAEQGKSASVNLKIKVKDKYKIDLIYTMINMLEGQKGGCAESAKYSSGYVQLVLRLVSTGPLPLFHSVCLMAVKGHVCSAGSAAAL